MGLSIVILNYKSARLTREAVKNLLDLQLSWPHEIIVVDNNSRDGLEELLVKRYPVVKFIQAGKNLGMGAGNNLGIKAAQGKYILVLNPDVIAQAEALERMVGFLGQNRQAGVVAPRLVNPDKTWQASVYNFPRLSTPLYRRTPLGQTSKGRQRLASYEVAEEKLLQPIKIHWALGAALMIRRDLLEKLGGFDERFFLFFEDIDLCRRAWAAGREVWYLPEAHMVHYPHRLSAHGQGLKSLLNKNTYPHIASWLKYFWKWRGKNKAATL